VKLLLKSQVRFLARSPWSAATALVGVALGVASVVAVHLIGAEVQRSLDAAAPPHLRTLSHVLDRDALDAEDYFTLRDAWRKQPGVGLRGLVPLVEGQVLVGGEPAQLTGADWLTLPPPTAGDDAPLSVPDTVLVGRAVLADSALELEAGDAVVLGGREVTVAEVLDTGLGDALFADIALAHHLLGAGPGRVDRVGLALEDPWALWRQRLDRLMPGIGAGLPETGSDDVRTLLATLTPGAAPGWRIFDAAAERPSAALARSVLFNLGALGTLALLVSWFLIHQVGVIWLRRQRLVLSRLHELGAAPGSLRQAFLLLFVGIGAISTVIGVLLGSWLAAALLELSTTAVEVSASAGTAAALDAWVLGKAVVSGVGVCLVGGLGAFAREWRPGASAPGRRLALVALLAVIIGAGIGIEATGVLGGFAAIFAMSLIGVAAVSPVLASLRRGLVSRRMQWMRLLTRLALREVAWYPRVLSVALAALTLAIATSIGIGVMVESFRADFQRMLELRLAGDLYVYDVDGRVEAVAAWLDDRAEVARLGRFGENRTRLGGVPVDVGFARFDAAESARYGHDQALAAGEVLVSERLLRDLDLSVGESLRTESGSLRIAGMFPGFGDPRGRVLVDVASLDRLDLEPRFTRISVDLVPGTDPGTLSGPLTAGFPGVSVESRQAVRALALDIFDRTFAITQALTLLALLVAVVGTYNALTALRLQQASTTRLLEAQGVDRGGARRIALVRAGTVGGVAVALALPLGLAMAWTLCAVINPRSFGWTVALDVPLSGWLPPVLLGLAAALLTGALPAPRERGALHEAG